MKLSELQYLSTFLEVFFSFFKEFDITSCVSPLKDLDGMRRRLLEAEVLKKSYLCSINQFSIDVNFQNGDEDDVYYFLFGRSDSVLPSGFLLDVWYRSGFLTIEIDDEKYPPFVRDFLNKSGELEISFITGEDELINVDENEIMSMDELKSFLRMNSIRKDVIRIEVD